MHGEYERSEQAEEEGMKLKLYKSTLMMLSKIYGYDDPTMADALELRRIVSEVTKHHLDMERAPDRGGLDRMVPWLEVITRFFLDRYDININDFPRGDETNKWGYQPADIGALAKARRKKNELF